jgi:Domain of Unknown Function (DUF928)
MFSPKFSRTQTLIASACSCLAVSTAIALPLSLSLFAPSSQAQSRRVRYNPPSNLGTPIVSTPGILRSDGCKESVLVPICLIGLVPDFNVDTAPVPLTISERPTIYFLIPKVDGNVSFTLAEEDIKNDKGRRIYKTTFYLKSKAGIITFKIPDHVQGLKIGKNYSWVFTKDSTQEDSRSLNVIGSMRRISPSQNLVDRLKKVSLPIDRAALFAQEGIWYEAVQTLAEALQVTPKKAEIVSEWNELLKSAKLNRVLPHSFVNTAETSSESTAPHSY